MFKNRITVILIVAVLFAIAIGLHFFGGEKRDKVNNITIVPEDVALVIETKNFASILDKFNSKNQFQNAFSNIREWSDFFEISEVVDTIIKKNSDLKDILDNNKITMAARVGINNTFEFICSVPVYDSDDEELILETISSYLGDNQTISKGVYDGKEVYNFNQTNPAKRLFSYAVVDGIFMISEKKSLIEEAIRQLVHPEQSIEHKGLQLLTKTANENSDFNVYVNYSYFPNVFKNFLYRRRSSFYDFFKRFADWTAMDMKYQNYTLFMSGFTHVDHSKKRYLKILKDQSSLPNTFLSSLPRNTAAFIAMNISNPEAWKKNYDIYLQDMGRYMSTKEYLDSISRRLLPDAKNLFYRNIKGAVCAAWIDKNTSDKDLEQIGIVELRHSDNFANILKSSRKNKSEDSEIDAGGSEVFKILEPKLFKYLFGDAFSGLKSNYGIIYNDRLIVAESVDALKLYLRKLKTLGALSMSKNFKVFSKPLSSESNIYAYLNLNLSTGILTKNLNKSKKSLYKRNIERFNSIYAVAIQYGVAQNGVYTNFCTKISSKFRKQNKNSWEVKLDAASNMKPAVVRNHATGNKEILIQNKRNKLSFISASGKVRWTKRLDGKILSPIYQVDKYKNNKIQYLFNTVHKIYLLDRNGDNVEGFPISLPSLATNACAVFDYDHSRTYRILVASADRQVRMYDIDGNSVAGWGFKHTNSIVKMPVQHFVDEDKDYIIFADYKHIYIVNRKGEIRITIDNNQLFNKKANAKFFFEKSHGTKGSRFVVMGENSQVYFIYLDGDINKMPLNKLSTHNQFIYADIYGNGKKQFVVTDKNVLYVFNRGGALRFKLNFKGDLKNSLHVYKFDKELYLGVSPEGENKIYLVTPQGKIVRGFPLAGSGEFSISKLDNKDKSSKMDIITGNAGKYLFNYKLVIN